MEEVVGITYSKHHIIHEHEIC